MEKLNGKIIRAVGGLFYTETARGILCCTARGIFRNRDISPVTGDDVTVITDDNSEPVIDEIKERRNELIRPPLANLDMALLVVSACEPEPNGFVIDKLVCVFESKGIETVPVFTKKDKADVSALMETYSSAGYRCFETDNLTGEGTQSIRDYAKGKVCALIGNSGVGKSSLINRIFPELNSETAEISRKLGRGRHTTREVIMYPLGGGYIADTPGFSTVDIRRYGQIPKEEIRHCFREFAPYHGKCRFADCMHLRECGCAVTKAVADGMISKSRYESYARMFTQTAEEEKKFRGLAKPGKV